MYGCQYMSKEQSVITADIFMTMPVRSLRRALKG